MTGSSMSVGRRSCSPRRLGQNSTSTSRPKASAFAACYWIQFEGRLDRGGRPYDYSSDPLVDIAGKSFHTSFRFYPPSGFAGPQGSDGDQARELIEAKGYTFDPDLARVRLVWLLGEPPLDELMVIYVEALEQHGLTLSELDNDDAAWESFKRGLLDRAIAGMQVVPLDE